MKTFFWFVLATFVILVSTLFVKNEFTKRPIPNTQIPVTVALDWTPNTNHTGIYVAIANGIYKNEGLDVKILPASSVSSDVLVSSGKADVGISSTEGVVSDSAAGSPVVSIAAILQHNTSSLVALENNGIKSPKDLDGKIYGGFGAPYESAVVSEIIKKDGGKGEFRNVTLQVDSLQALQAKKIDFAWIFDGWEGIQAKKEGMKLLSFPINTNGIADYYTPVFITSTKTMSSKQELLKKFMAATAKGYEYAVLHPEAAANILIDTAPKGTFQDKDFVIESQKYLSSRYTEKGVKWGFQDKNAWHNYPQFMLDSNAILDQNGKPVKKLDFDSLYTNKFLQ